MKKILIVEGTQPVDGLGGSLFKRRECTLAVASSASEALAQAETEPVDLVIYDAFVEDLTPEDFIQALQSHEQGQDTGVIVVVAEGADHLEGPLLRSGASAVLVRPVDEIELNTKVCELLGISLRRHLRTFVKMKVDATVGTTTHFATIANISLGGTLIETEKPLRIGDIIKLAFFLPGDETAITVISRVVREASPGPPRSYGCLFLDLSETARHRIHEFVSTTEG